MLKYTNKLGIVCLEPEEGFLLEKNGFTFKKVFLGPKDSAELYNEVLDKSYIAKEINEEEQLREQLLLLREKEKIEDLKSRMISLSKDNLKKYLENNPLFSKVKHEEGRFYNVTLEQQLLLADTINIHKLAMEKDSSYRSVWNTSGEAFEVWELDELIELSLEIKNYVNPLIFAQQCMELKIKECTDVQSLNLIDISFSEDSLNKYKSLFDNIKGLS